MKKSALLIVATSILFACATKKEPVATEPAPQAEYEKIITEIKSGLTSDARVNRVYLYKQIERYENHEQAKEITSGIVKIIFEELIKNFEKDMSQDFVQLDSAFRKANDLLFKGNPHEALVIIKPEVEELELIRAFILKDDSTQIYRSFNNIVEEGIYWEMAHNSPLNTFRPLPRSFVYSYFTYGTTLVELKLYDEAKDVLLKALELNPVYTDMIFELGVTIQAEKDWKGFLSLTQAAHRFSYTKEDIAHCYRNYGYYFIEQKQFDDAIAMYYASLSFDSTQIKKVLSELDYIQHTTKKMIPKLDEKQILSVFEKNNIKFGADDTLLKAIQSLGQKLEKKKRYDEAKYCYKVLYELTGDKKFKELAEKDFLH